jgi:exopolysaccharide biosynthesis operon protein EpsL
VACVLATIALRAAPAAAELTVLMGASVTQDANLFRVPQDPSEEVIHSFNVGLDFNKQYGQQTLQANITRTETHYQRFAHLDYEALDYRAAWLWHLTPRVTGSLSIDHKQAPVGFEDSPGSARNLRDTDTSNFTFDGWLFGGWHALFGAEKKKQISEVVTQQESDFESQGVSAGAMYVSPSGRSITLNVHGREGRYLNRPLDQFVLLDNRYYEDEVELKATYDLGGRTTLKGRLGLLERRHEHFPQRDFAGPVGDLSIDWSATGKLRLSVTARRELTQSSDLFSSHVVKDTLAVIPSLQFSAKLSARGSR